MSEISSVIDSYESAQKAENEGNFLKAARYYRLCCLFYENGELPIFVSQVQDYGESSYEDYIRCREKLDVKSQCMLDNEERRYVKGDSYWIASWREFVEEEYQRIMKEAGIELPL